MSLPVRVYGDEEEEAVKLSAADVKKYEAKFSQLVVQFSNLNFIESVGEGNIMFKNIQPNYIKCCSNLTSHKYDLCTY